jgi:dihydrofolate reductase
VQAWLDQPNWGFIQCALQEAKTAAGDKNVSVMGGAEIAQQYIRAGLVHEIAIHGEFEHRGWTIPYWNDELAKYHSDQLFASDALLLGRVTYQEFVASWPLRSGDPFSDRMNSLPKFVASTTLQAPLEWNATLLKEDLAEEVAKLKQQSGQDILIYGSGELVNTLMQHNLIDVYRVMLYPLVLGTGKRFFRDGGEKTTLTLTEVKTNGAGVVMLTYRAAQQE